MAEDVERPQRGPIVGGRHGSPTVTVALPFSSITNVDSELRDALVDLALLVAELAAHTTAGDTSEMTKVAESAEELAARLSSSAG